MIDWFLERKLEIVDDLCRRADVPRDLHCLCLSRMRHGDAEHGNDMSHLDLLGEGQREVADAINYTAAAESDGKLGDEQARRAAYFLREAYKILSGRGADT